MRNEGSLLRIAGGLALLSVAAIWLYFGFSAFDRNWAPVAGVGALGVAIAGFFVPRQIGVLLIAFAGLSAAVGVLALPLLILASVTSASPAWTHFWLIVVLVAGTLSSGFLYLESAWRPERASV